MQRHSILGFDVAEPPQVWLAIFVDPPPPTHGAPLSNRLLALGLTALKPGFRHVLAVSPVAGGFWLICNPGSCRLGLAVARSPAVLTPIRDGVAARQMRCLAVTARESGRVRFRGLFTCVNMVAHLTGVDCRPWSTPWRLYRRLRAQQTRRDASGH